MSKTGSDDRPHVWIDLGLAEGRDQIDVGGGGKIAGSDAGPCIIDEIESLDGGKHSGIGGQFLSQGLVVGDAVKTRATGVDYYPVGIVDTVYGHVCAFEQKLGLDELAFDHGLEADGNRPVDQGLLDIGREKFERVLDQADLAVVVFLAEGNLDHGVTGGKYPGVHDMAHGDGSLSGRCVALARLFERIPEIVGLGIFVAMLFEIGGNALTESLGANKLVDLIKYRATLFV